MQIFKYSIKFLIFISFGLTQLNRSTGSKEITLSSSVKFFNNMCRTIVVEFRTAEPGVIYTKNLQSD